MKSVVLLVLALALIFPGSRAQLDFSTNTHQYFTYFFVKRNQESVFRYRLETQEVVQDQRQNCSTEYEVIWKKGTAPDELLIKLNNVTFTGPCVSLANESTSLKLPFGACINEDGELLAMKYLPEDSPASMDAKQQLLKFIYFDKSEMSDILIKRGQLVIYDKETVFGNCTVLGKVHLNPNNYTLEFITVRSMCHEPNDEQKFLPTSNTNRQLTLDRLKIRVRKIVDKSMVYLNSTPIETKRSVASFELIKMREPEVNFKVKKMKINTHCAGCNTCLM